MPIDVILAVLGAAFVHACWNALAKGRGSADPLLATLTVAIGGAVVAVPLLAVTGLPSFASAPYGVASAIIHVAYFVLVGLAYRYAEMSAIYPLTRGTAPLITALAASLFLGEAMPLAMIAGILLLGAGVLGLGANALLRGGLDGRGLAVAATNICVIVVYTLVDGLGARVSGNPFGYVVLMMLLTGVMLVPLAIRPRGARGFFTYLREAWVTAFAGGLMVMASYGIALWAMTRAPIGAVAALRETSVLFGTAIAALLLGERFGLARWVAAAAICAGLMLIRLA